MWDASICFKYLVDCFVHTSIPFLVPSKSKFFKKARIFIAKTASAATMLNTGRARFAHNEKTTKKPTETINWNKMEFHWTTKTKTHNKTFLWQEDLDRIIDFRCK